MCPEQWGQSVEKLRNHAAAWRTAGETENMRPKEETQGDGATVFL